MEPQIPGERKAHALQSRISEDSAACGDLPVLRRTQPLLLATAFRGRTNVLLGVRSLVTRLP